MKSVFLDSKRGIFATVCAPVLLAVAFASIAQGPSVPDSSAAKADAAATKPAAKMKKGAIRAPGEQEPLESPTKAPLRTPAKAPAKSTDSGVTVQRFDPRTPIPLHDANGNAIPTSPEAYDVSSATGKKK